MTKTSQLDAHYAVIQADSVARSVVMSFQLTVDLLIAEVRERAADDTARHRLRELLARYRAAVLELGDVLGSLRAQCGTDPFDLPDADDEVRDELARISLSRDKAKSAKRQPAGAYRQGSAALAAATDEALDYLRNGGGL
jgi:hypothetical protein